MKNLIFTAPDYENYRSDDVIDSFGGVTGYFYLAEDPTTQEMLVQRFIDRTNFTDMSEKYNLSSERIRQKIDQFSRKVKSATKNERDRLFKSVIDFEINNFQILEDSFFVNNWCPSEFLSGLLSDIYNELPTRHNVNRNSSRFSSRPFYPYRNRCDLLFENRFMVPIAEAIDWIAEIPVEYAERSITGSELSGKLDGIRFLLYSPYISFIKEEGKLFLIYYDDFSDLAEKMIRHYDRALSFDEIIEILKPHNFRIPSNRSEAISSLRANRDILQLSREMFGIAKHTSYPPAEWDAIRKFAEAILEREKKIVDLALLFEETIKVFDKLSSKEELGFILRRAYNIQNTAGRLFAHSSVDISTIKTLPHLVSEILKSQRGIASKDQIFQYVSSYRSYSSEGFTSNLKSINLIQYYEGNYYGFKSPDKKNRQLLSQTPEFICSYMLEKLHPKTTMEDIIAGFSHFNPQKVVATIRSEERFVVVNFPGSESEVVICKNWSRNKIIVSIVYHSGEGIDHPTLCTWLVKLDQKFQDIQIPNLMQLGIKFSQNIYTYQAEKK